MNQDIIKLIDNSINSISAIEVKYLADAQSKGKVIGTLNMLKIMLNNCNMSIMVTEKD